MALYGNQPRCTHESDALGATRVTTRFGRACYLRSGSIALFLTGLPHCYCRDGPAVRRKPGTIWEGGHPLPLQP